MMTNPNARRYPIKSMLAGQDSEVVNDDGGLPAATLIFGNHLEIQIGGLGVGLSSFDWVEINGTAFHRKGSLSRVPDAWCQGDRTFQWRNDL